MKRCAVLEAAGAAAFGSIGVFFDRQRKSLP
jgi:hypothetical protein